ncbi:MAG TPA: hypothetical protein ENH85_00525 [Candidatus Scalindua sp.]|nr:hypothetical protein [Candidatus Scalindua sp.]
MNLKNIARKLRDIYCYLDFFLNRGLGLFNSVYQIAKYTAFAGIIVTMANEAFGLNISMDKVIVVVPFMVIALILAGIIDVKKVKALQKSNEISTKYNTYLVKLITKNKRK